MDFAGSSPATIAASTSKSSNPPQDPAILAVGPPTGARRGRGGRRGNPANPHIAGPSASTRQPSTPLPLITDQWSTCNTTAQPQRPSSLRSRGQGPRGRSDRIQPTPISEGEGQATLASGNQTSMGQSEPRPGTLKGDPSSTMPDSGHPHVPHRRPRGGFRGGFRGRLARYTSETHTLMPDPAPLSILRDAVEQQPKTAQADSNQACEKDASAMESTNRILQALREIPRQVKQTQSVQRSRPMKPTKEEPECRAGALAVSVSMPDHHQRSDKSLLAPDHESSQATRPEARKPRPTGRGKPRNKRVPMVDTTTQQPFVKARSADPSASAFAVTTSMESQTLQESATDKARTQAFLSRHPRFVPDSQASQRAKVTPAFTHDTSTPPHPPSNSTTDADPAVKELPSDPTLTGVDTSVPKKKKPRKPKKKLDKAKAQAEAAQSQPALAVLPQPSASPEAADSPIAKRKANGKRGYSVPKFGPAFSSTGRSRQQQTRDLISCSNDPAPKNPNVRMISSEEAQMYKLVAKAKSLAEPTYTRPPPASDVCGFVKLPAELRNYIYNLVFRGLFILDGGWTIRDLNDHPEWNDKKAPVFYQVDKSRANNEVRRCLSPIHMRAHTSLMFTCKQIYHEYSHIVYSDATVAVARPRLIRQRFLTPATARPNVRRRLVDGNVPSNPSRPALRMPPSWITNMHLKIDAYGFPMIKDRIQQRLRYYIGWQKTCQGLAETMTGLKDLTLHLAKPTELGYNGPTLVEDCTLAVEPLRDMSANGTKIHVMLKMDWDMEKKDAFAGFLGRWLNGDDFPDCREALMTGKKDVLRAMLKDFNVVERLEKMQEPEFKQATKDWDRLLQANEVQPEYLYRSVVAGVNMHGKTFRFFSKKWIQTAAEWEEDPSIWKGLEFM